MSDDYEAVKQIVKSKSLKEAIELVTLIEMNETLQDIHSELTKKPKTDEIHYGSVPVSGSWLLCDLAGSGFLREATIITKTSNFSIQIQKDGSLGDVRSYTELAADSQYLSDIVAFTKNSDYVVHIKNLAFKRSLRVIVQGNFTVDRAYVKYDLEG